MQKAQATHVETVTGSEDPIVTALQAYTTCDVSDALIKLKDPAVNNGGFLAGLTMWSPERQAGAAKIVGPAYTVQYSPISDDAPKVDYHYIDKVPARAVIFVSAPRVPNALYGGLMSIRARAREAIGSVIDGKFRDLQEQRELGFPIFARDVGTAPPHELLKVTGTQVDVIWQQGEQRFTISPGDYLIGDLNGVVLLPRRLATQVLPLMQKQVEADAKMAKAIVEEGMGFAEASRRFRG